jgi:hypothetical protein
MTSGVANNPWSHIGAPSVDPYTTLPDVESSIITELTPAKVEQILFVPFVVNSRDTLGRVTNYTIGAITYAVVYGDFGVQTISGGGVTRTVSYSAAGLITGVTDA